MSTSKSISIESYSKELCKTSPEISYQFKGLIFFSIIFFLINSSFVYGEPEGITLTKTSTGYYVGFVLSQYEMVTTIAEGEEYINLALPGYGVIPETGLPALPLISFNLFISYSELQPEVNLLSATLSEEILPNKIFPFQMPWEK